MTGTLVALGVIVASVGMVVVDYLAYRREQDEKSERARKRSELDDEIRNGGNIARIQSLSRGVRD